MCGERSQSELQFQSAKVRFVEEQNIVRHPLHIATDSNMKAISMSCVKQFLFWHMCKKTQK